jgi:hypothetical protein
LNGAPTTAINATTVPAEAAAFAIGAAVRHLMTFCDVPTLFLLPHEERGEVDERAGALSGTTFRRALYRPHEQGT